MHLLNVGSQERNKPSGGCTTPLVLLQRLRHHLLPSLPSLPSRTLSHQTQNCRLGEHHIKKLSHYAPEFLYYLKTNLA